MRPSVRASALPASSYLPPKKKLAELPSPKFPSGGLKCLNHYLGTSAAAPPQLSRAKPRARAKPGQAKLSRLPRHHSPNCPKHPQFVFPACGRGCVVKPTFWHAKSPPCLVLSCRGGTARACSSCSTVDMLNRSLIQIALYRNPKNRIIVQKSLQMKSNYCRYIVEKYYSISFHTPRSILFDILMAIAMYLI